MKLRKILALTVFILKLCWKEKVVISLFIVGLLLLSVINIIFMESFQKYIYSQLEEFTSWADIAQDTGVMLAVFLIILFISISFLSVLRSLFSYEYIGLFLSKPLGFYEYIFSVFSGIFLTLVSLILFWSIFVGLTLYFHGYNFIFSTYISFFYVGVIALVSLSYFLFLYSCFKSALASLISLVLLSGGMFSVGIESFISNLSFPLNKIMSVSYFFIPPLYKWFFLAVEEEKINFSIPILVLHSSFLVLIFLLSSFIRFKRNIINFGR